MYGMKLNFYKDLGIAGGLFALVACGAGAWSMDARRGTVGPASSPDPVSAAR